MNWVNYTKLGQDIGPRFKYGAIVWTRKMD